jgi:hypothetical protein
MKKRMVALLISLCTLGATAPQAARSQPHFPEGAINLMVPQFVAEAVRFKAIDESGYDSWGSDQVYAVFSDLNPTLGDLLTRVYEYVDTGETRDFGRDERCIAPRPRCAHGVSEFLHFEVSFWERDEPPWPFSEWCYGDIPGLHYLLRHGMCNFDDLIGHRQVLMSREQLLDALPAVGDSVEQKLTLGGGCPPSQDVCASFGPEYELTFRITRLPDVERPLVIALPHEG